MDLYPQPRGREASVEYVPGRRTPPGAASRPRGTTPPLGSAPMTSTGLRDGVRTVSETVSETELQKIRKLRNS
jgi:hypothetical protein